MLIWVMDRAKGDLAPFDYDMDTDASTLERDGIMGLYNLGDGTSKQWLFYARSDAKKQIKVFRVLNGKLDREDETAKLYENKFGATGVTHTPLDLDKLIDSDEAVKIAKQNGFVNENLAEMYLTLNAERHLPGKPNATAAKWYVEIGGMNSKVIELNPVNGEVINSDS